MRWAHCTHYPLGGLRVAFATDTLEDVAGDVAVGVLALVVDIAIV